MPDNPTIDPIVRPAQAADGPALFVLAKSFATSFQVEPKAFESSLQQLLATQSSLLAVATNEDRVVGYVLGFDHPTFYANGRVAWVEEIMVAEDARRLGIGRKLIAFVEEWAQGRDAKLIALATRRAAAFYRSLGYEESATYFIKLLY